MSVVVGSASGEEFLSCVGQRGFEPAGMRRTTADVYDSTVRRA